jgi:hypothetical protein
MTGSVMQIHGFRPGGEKEIIHTDVNQVIEVQCNSVRLGRKNYTSASDPADPANRGY